MGVTYSLTQIVRNTHFQRSKILGSNWCLSYFDSPNNLKTYHLDLP